MAVYVLAAALLLQNRRLPSRPWLADFVARTCENCDPRWLWRAVAEAVPGLETSFPSEVPTLEGTRRLMQRSCLQKAGFFGR